MYGMVLPRFVSQALHNQPITIYGDGTQTRCFGWVGDVVGALVKLIMLPAAEGLVFNIGSDEEVSINELAQVVKDVTGSSSPVEYIPYERAYSKDFEEMIRRVPDLTRVRTAIGYTPTRKLREIVESVAASLTHSADGHTDRSKAFELSLVAPAS
jgi:UDP-glucose 4-epimerase